MSDYVVIETYKEDVLGSIQLVQLQNGTKAICRQYSDAVWILRPLAYVLAAREASILKKISVLNTEQLPRFIDMKNGYLLRSYVAGNSLRKTPVDNVVFYERAGELVRQLHTCGVVHNDLEKPENWVVIDEHNPGIIDFQIAMKLQSGWWFNMLSHEDLRHVIKQKKRFCNTPLSDEETVLLENRSAFGNWWKRYFKPAYNFITRKIFNYTDGSHSRYSR